MRFLVIDDSMPMRRIISNVLSRLGHTDITFAANGREALKQVESERIDFIITDWYMPEMTGLEFVRALRSKDATRDVPIVIVTANASKDDVAQAVQLRVNGYVLKPFTAEILRERIDAICATLAPATRTVAAEPGAADEAAAAVEAAEIPEAAAAEIPEAVDGAEPAVLEAVGAP
jgi:two-component system, chemotaxis family, chemotaxis protein CheY